MSFIERAEAAAAAFSHPRVSKEEVLTSITDHENGGVVVWQGETYPSLKLAYKKEQEANSLAHSKRRRAVIFAAGTAALSIVDGIAFTKYGHGVKEYVLGGASSLALGAASAREGFTALRYGKQIVKRTDASLAIGRENLSRATNSKPTNA